MGFQRRLEIYVGNSSSLIRYLEPLTRDILTTCFADCHFNESAFPPLRGEKLVIEKRREITWNASTMSHLDHHTNQCELEVQRIIHFQNLANQLPNAFIGPKKVSKSQTLIANAPTRIDVLKDN